MDSAAIDFKQLMKEERRKAKQQRQQQKQQQKENQQIVQGHTTTKDNKVVTTISSAAATTTVRIDDGLQEQEQQQQQLLPPWPHPIGYVSFNIDYSSCSTTTSSTETNVDDTNGKEKKNNLSTKDSSSSFSYTKLGDKYLMCEEPSSLHYIRNIFSSKQLVQQDIWNWLTSLPQSSNDSGINSWKTLKYSKRRVAMFGENSDGIPLPRPLYDISQLLIKHGMFSEDIPPNHVLINDYYNPTYGILSHTDGPMYYPKTVTVSLIQDQSGDGADKGDEDEMEEDEQRGVIFTFTPRRRNNSEQENQNQQQQPQEQLSLSSSPTTRKKISQQRQNDEKEAEGEATTKAATPKRNHIQIVLHSNSLVLFQNDLYTNYCHGIEELKQQQQNEQEESLSEETSFVEHTATSCVNSLKPNTKVKRGCRRISLTFRHKYIDK